MFEHLKLKKWKHQIDVKVKTNYLDRTKTSFSDCPTNYFIFHKLFSKIIILNILNYNEKFTLFFNKSNHF